MKATLITFDKKVVDVRDYQDRLLVFHKQNVIKDMRDFTREDRMFMGEPEKTVYENIQLIMAERGYSITRNYFINQDDFKLVLPFINAVIDKETKRIRRENMKLVEEVFSLKRKWYYRIWNWIEGQHYLLKRRFNKLFNK